MFFEVIVRPFSLQRENINEDRNKLFKFQLIQKMSSTGVTRGMYVSHSLSV